MCKTGRMLTEVETELEANEKLVSLKEKITRTTKFLKELKTLSKSCQEISTCQITTGDNPDDALRERQVFVRRIVQLRAELEDGRDLVLALCKNHLPATQWRLMAEDLQGDTNTEESDADDENGEDRRQFGFGRNVLTGFDVDPSVRFFGIDWESVFGRCFSLALNANIFGDQILDAVVSFSSNDSERKRDDFDLVLINRILRDLAALEADVTSHAEAVLQGRLSKSQRKLIQREQLKYSTPVSSTYRLTTNPSTKTSAAVSKSRSFRDVNKNTTSSAKARQAIKYKKNKTTNLDKLSSAATSPTDNGIDRSHLANGSRNSVDDDSFSSGDEQKKLLEAAATLVTATSTGGAVTTVVSPTTNGIPDLQLRKKKTSFIQNVSSMLKNIR